MAATGPDNYGAEGVLFLQDNLAMVCVLIAYGLDGLNGAAASYVGVLFGLVTWGGILVRAKRTVRMDR